MNGIRNSLIALLAMCLAACASRPAEDHYYSLVLAADDVAPSASVDRSATRIIVGPIQLARYLNRTGLILQQGSSEIRTANHHFWAEPLDEAIAKVLVRDISRQLDTIAVDRDAGQWTDEGDCQLRVELDRFHATDDSRVVVTGRYWIHDSDSPRVEKREFDIVQTLTAGGYPHAVQQLRASLQKLSNGIVEQLADSTVCLTDSPPES